MVASAAVQVAGSMPMVHDLHGQFQQRLLTRTANLVPETDTWLNLYRQRDAVMSELLETFCPMGGQHSGGVNGFWARGVLRGRDVVVRELAKAEIRDLPVAVKVKLRTEIENALRFQYQEELRALSAELRGEPIPDGINLDEAFAKPSSLFFMRVCLPCAVEFGKTPWTLYAEAQRGERAAILHLLTVDKLILRDEGIAEQAARLGLTGDELSKEAVAKAFVETPAFGTTPRGLNALMAGLASNSLEPLGYMLATKDIRALFDAAARDRTGVPAQIETELAESPEALKQALHRAKGFWKGICDGNTESLNSCHRELGLMAVVSTADETATRPFWIDGRRTEQGA
jgi:hypothetical protein